MSHASIQQAATLLKSAQTAFVLTGAGVSKESGVPTFRDAQTGFWEQYDPEDLATPQAFQANPKLVWEWYEFRRKMVAEVEPNPGHYALKDLEQHFDTLPIVTQNVDDLHERAGSTTVMHLHGTIAGHKCFYDCQGDPTLIDINTLTYNPADGPPHCPHCDRKSVRPNVVWFGENLPMKELQHAQALAVTCDVILVIGTSGMVHPAARIPIIARDAGATLIEVNPDVTMLTRYMDVRLEGPSGEMLPQLIEAMTDA